MGELSSRSVNEPGKGDSRQNEKERAARSRRGPVARARSGLVWILALLLPGAIAPPPAHAQDDRPKAEPPKSAPPTAPAESPQRPDPPPPDAQKNAAAPADTQKDAPTAPADAQKPAPDAPADAPKPPPAAAPDADREAVFDAAVALSTRYKFVERYAIDDDPTATQLITQYRVGVLETTEYLTEKSTGAPNALKGAATRSIPSGRPRSTSSASRSIWSAAMTPSRSRISSTRAP